MRKTAPRISCSKIQNITTQFCLSWVKSEKKVQSAYECGRNRFVCASTRLSLFQLGYKRRLLPPTVTRLHRYEWNSNWVKNVQWANGSAMLAGWPALCLVCQGEGLFGLHQEGLCVSVTGGPRQRTGRSDTSSGFRDCVEYAWTSVS